MFLANAGVVTSVPSDSPDDYTALQELKSKPKLREKFLVEDAWVEYDVSPTVSIKHGSCIWKLKLVVSHIIPSMTSRWTPAV